MTIYAESEAKAKEALALLDDAYEFIAEEIVIDGDIIKYVV